MTDRITQSKQFPTRWRRLAVVAGSLAVVAGVGAAHAHQAVADDSPVASRPSADTGGVEQIRGAADDKPRAATRKQADTQPLSGIEAWKATLLRLVPDGVVTDDVPTGMNYEPNRDGSPNALGGAELVPSAGADAGDLIVDYWPAKPLDAQLHTQCQPLLDECETLTLPDGSVVVTYVVRPVLDVPGLDQGPAVAAHRIVGGNVVTLLAGAPGEDTDTVLTRDQLVDVISQPEWANLKPAA